jgi:hypothetical protein
MESIWEEETSFSWISTVPSAETTCSMVLESGI